MLNELLIDDKLYIIRYIFSFLYKDDIVEISKTSKIFLTLSIIELYNRKDKKSYKNLVKSGNLVFVEYILKKEFKFFDNNNNSFSYDNWVYSRCFLKLFFIFILIFYLIILNYNYDQYILKDEKHLQDLLTTYKDIVYNWKVESYYFNDYETILLCEEDCKVPEGSKILNFCKLDCTRFYKFEKKISKFGVTFKHIYYKSELNFLGEMFFDELMSYTYNIVDKYNNSKKETIKPFIYGDPSWDHKFRRIYLLKNICDVFNFKEFLFVLNPIRKTEGCIYTVYDEVIRKGYIHYGISRGYPGKQNSNRIVNDLIIYIELYPHNSPYFYYKNLLNQKIDKKIDKEKEKHKSFIITWIVILLCLLILFFAINIILYIIFKEIRKYNKKQKIISLIEFFNKININFW